MWSSAYKNSDILDEAVVKLLGYYFSFGEENSLKVLSFVKGFLEKEDAKSNFPYSKSKIIASKGGKFFQEQYATELRNYVENPILNYLQKSDDKLNKGVEAFFQGASYIIGFYHASHWFAETRINPEVDGKLKALTKLSPSTNELRTHFNADFNQLAFLGLVIKGEAQKFISESSDPKIQKLRNPHIAGFGTGGDGVHTINMTTLCMPIAAEYYKRINYPNGNLDFIKLSTKAVTGLIGGADVAGEFLKKIRKPDNFEIITLGELGFPYSRELVEARKKFAGITSSEFLIDPYKVIYPLVNLSNAEYVTTGCHNELFETAQAIANKVAFTNMFGEKDSEGYHRMQNLQNQIFVTSKLGNDEFMPGDNSIGFRFMGINPRCSGLVSISNETIRDTGLNLSDREYELAMQFIEEQPNVRLQAKRMHQILGVESTSLIGIPESANMVVATNAAMFLPSVIEAAQTNDLVFKAELNLHSRKIFGMLQEFQQGKNNPFSSQRDVGRY